MKDTLAVVSMDMQNEAVHMDSVFGQPGLFGDQGIAREVVRKGVLEKAREVLDRARAAGVMVVHVGTRYRPGYPELNRGHPVFDQVQDLGVFMTGDWGVEFHELIAPQGDEAVVWKSRVNAFYQTDLQAMLRSQGIRTIAAQGVALNNVVESTVRDAADMGFEAIVLSDCVASFDGEQDDFCAQRILPRFCRVMESSAFFKEAGI